ncbi:MAG: MraY family glycosyltransferase, partial [Acidimicrobiia bacterium]
IFVGVHAALAVAGEFDAGLAVATGILLLLGLADDRVGLSPLLRLAGEVAAAVTLVTLSDLELDGAMVTVAAIVLVVVAVNAVNLFDGLDGLAGSAALITALGLAWLAATRGLEPIQALVTAAALGGFLVLNRHPARVFLGDNGAYVTGGLLAYAILGATPDGDFSPLAVATLVLGVFLADLAVTVIRRARARRPLFAGDRSHVYDQLRDRGWPIGRVVGSVAGAQVIFVLATLGVDRLDPTTAPWAAMAVGASAVLGLAALGFVRSVDSQ